MSRNEEFEGGSEVGKRIISDLPPAQGTSPIPPGHVRLYHQTALENVEAIKKEGLRADLGGRSGDPEGLWASSGKPFYRSGNGTATIEFTVPVQDLTDRASITSHVRSGEKDPEEWSKESHSVLLSKNVNPNQFIGIHEPWHDTARYIVDNNILGEVKSGEHDELMEDPHYGPAIKFIKGRL